MNFISWIRRQYDRIIKAGTEHTNDPEQIFRIELVNKLSLLIALLMLLIVPAVLIWVIYSPFYLACFIIEYLINASVILWNKLKLHRTASLTFYLNQCFFVAFFGIIFGGVQLQFAIVFLISVIYLIEKDNKIRAICFLLATLDLAALQTIYYLKLEPTTISDNSAFLIQNLVIAGVMIILFFISIPYRSGNDLRFTLLKENRNTQHYTANIAHEMRSPIHSVNIWVEKLKIELQKEELDRIKLTEIVSRISMGTQTVHGIIDNSLSLAEISEGKTPVNVMEHFLLKQFLLDLLDFNAILGQERQITFSFTMLEMPAIIVSDKNKIAQIVNNLFSNAIKFSKKRSKVLVAVQANPDRLTWSIIVKNYCHHTANIDLDEIYSPYVSGAAGKNVPNSTGLGLFITKEKVGELGGRIVCSKNDLANSIEFIVTLPLVPGQLKKLSDNKVNEEELRVARRILPGKKILITDDEEITAHATAIELERAGVVTVTAHSVKEMLIQAGSEKPDIIILDYQMPGLTGEQGLQLLKENPLVSHIPVIVTTGAVYNHDALDKMLRLGADDFVMKPVELNKLLVAIARVLNGKQKTVG